jgi:hypothetical protein
VSCHENDLSLTNSKGLLEFEAIDARHADIQKEAKRALMRGTAQRKARAESNASALI